MAGPARLGRTANSTGSSPGLLPGPSLLSFIHSFSRHRRDDSGNADSLAIYRVYSLVEIVDGERRADRDGAPRGTRLLAAAEAATRAPSS